MVPIFRLALVRLPDFRRLGASVLLNAVGMMGETVVLGWLTLELTNSPFMVGAALSMRMLPPSSVGVPPAPLPAASPPLARPIRPGLARAPPRPPSGLSARPGPRAAPQ